MDFRQSFQRFAGEPFYAFAIDDVRFSWDEREPQVVVRLGHCNTPGLVEIRFSDVVYHAVMSESYHFMHAEDAWSELAILAEAGVSQLRAFVVKYTLVEAMRGTVADLRHFRVLAQDFYLDVLTPTTPIIEVIDDA